MKYLSQLRFAVHACGIVAALTLATSCSSTISPQKAARRLAQSPVASIFSHNSVHLPQHRDCYEMGALSKRARSALITWLHDSTIKEMSYVYPQYYLVTANVHGGGEVVWAILSDGRGNMVGVLAPANKRIPAWDLPTIGSYKVYVCNTPERDALSAAIMEDLADPKRKPGTEVGYDQPRIDTLKASGLEDKRYLLSKPLNENEQKQLEQQRKERARVEQEAKNNAADEKAKSDVDDGQEEASDDASSSDDASYDSSSDDSSTSSSDDSDEANDSSSDGDSDGEVGDTGGADSDSEL